MIRVPCPHCGPVEVPAHHVVLTCSEGGASYLFLCSACHLRYYRDCPKWIAAKLERYVVVSRIEPEEHHGPPLTWDDVLDAVVALRGSGWERELIA